MVVYDHSAGETVVLASAETTSQAATDKAIFYFQQQGKKVLQIADYPGLLVWRTVAMLVNEALDALQKGVAGAEDIDTAMRLGVNYPRGPLAWGESLGWGRGTAAAGEPTTALRRGALSALFPAASEGADGETS